MRRSPLGLLPAVAWRVPARLRAAPPPFLACCPGRCAGCHMSWPHPGGFGSVVSCPLTRPGQAPACLRASGVSRGAFRAARR
eukprot:11805957-Alexandrium_andersonii.AAC.1